MAVAGHFQGYSVRENRDAHKSAVTHLAWNFNGKKLASEFCVGSEDETIKIWNVDMFSIGKDKKETELSFSRNIEINGIVWHPSHPDQLATCSSDNLIRIWDVRTSKAAYTTKMKKHNYAVLGWNPADPNILAAVQAKNETSFIDGRTQKVLSLLPSDKLVSEVSFSRDGKLFFRCKGQDLEIFSYPSLVKLHTVSGHSKTMCYDIPANEELLATGGADGIVTVWDLQTLTSIQSFYIIDSVVKEVRFSPDQEYLSYVCQDEKGVVIEHWKSGERAAFLETQNVVVSAKWNPFHAVLAYTGSFVRGDRMSHHRAFGMFNIFAPRGV